MAVGRCDVAFHAVGSELAVIDGQLQELLEAKLNVVTTAEELIHLAKDKLGGVKAPKSVDFIAALPRSPVGKVLKKDLRAPYWAGHDRKI